MTKRVVCGLVGLVIVFTVCLSTLGASASQPTVHIDNEQPGTPQAEHITENLEGRVTAILVERMVTPQGASKSQLYQKLEILITRGSLRGERVSVESGTYASSKLPEYRVGDRLVVEYTLNLQGEPSFRVTDYVRRAPLYWLLGILVVLVVAVGRWQGVTSLLGLGISFLVIFAYILPRILAGADPVQVALLGSMLIIPATFVLSHGFNLKTGVAIFSSLISLVITCMLADLFIDLARLTGYASEEAGFLQSYRPDVIDIRGLVFAGIILGVLGILDDITISQAAIARQIYEANPALSVHDIYSRAMVVGRDHIASMTNTLILVYAGASLPLLLLFVSNPNTILQVLNFEIVAEEAVRMLVGSIGLVLAVPITSIVAALTTRLQG